MKKPVLTLVAVGNTNSAGVRLVCSLARQHGFNVKLVFFKGFFNHTAFTPTELEILLDFLRDSRTDLVAMSVNIPVLQTATRVTNAIKEKLGTTVLWGGVHPTLHPEDAIQIADIICLGEGEYAFMELMQCLHEGTPIDNIQNLWINKKDGIQKNSMRPLLQDADLDMLPFPEYATEDIYFINNDTMINSEPTFESIHYETSVTRGCPYRCSYCLNSILRDIYPKDSKYVRKRSVENVISEIEQVRERLPNIQLIRFQDEVFPWQEDWLADFQREYKKRVKIPFVCTFHPNLVTEKNAALLKQAGVSTLGIGMEGTLERIRKDIFNRPGTNEQLTKAIKTIQKNKIEINLDLIFDNPYETSEDKSEGLDYLLSIPKPFTLTTFSLHYFPGYALTNKALKDGVITEQDVEKGDGSVETKYIKYDLKSNSVDEDMFWNSLFILSSRSVIPKFFVRFCKNSDFIRKRPSLLSSIVFSSKLVELPVIAQRRLRRRQLRWKALRAAMKFKVIKRIYS